ncbi:hypothetical protein [Massilia sp. Leaf139]|uniref:hypothetical protein n=1 Tax=Massilia sp. Leaf139 TaxID=1736272 RepID=UPI0006F9589B|nr:hypothetical protein [Massilia sp. Leaf139]KQQ89225.1 hypothetical protein ASF77_11215 [Massilia sp. Leaf139]
MTAFLRPLIVWLLLLALPYQGLAAAAMAACGTAHGVPMPAASGHVQHTVEQAQPPCHEAAPAVTAEEREAAPLHADGASCGTCSNCGIGSAMLPAGLTALVSHAPAGASTAFADRPLPSVHLPQPERPPRPRLV